MNKMAEDGINFMRMYTEPACTPTRAAFQTGRYAVRSGMHTVSFPVEYSGMDADEVTIAEVLSEAGYMTGFFGKWHLGDTEFSYAHNQGYDEAFFTPYNQVPSMWTKEAESMNVITGMFPDMYGEDKYDIDKSWQPLGAVWFLEGTKGGKTYEWGPPPKVTDYWDGIAESEKRTIDFINKALEAKKPFFISHQPILLSFIPDPRNPVKGTANKNPLAEALERLDVFVGKLQKHLQDKGIAENTLIMVMADNGPFIHYGPRGMVETLYTGGKGDFTEGGVRVPCIATWPGVIEPGQIVGDILHVSDLYTTFARLGGAMENIPTDRVIDGVDQTALFLNGDGYSRRDYVMIYVGPSLAGAVKGRFKRDWKNATPGLSKNEFYDLYTDPRERTGEMIEMFHVKSMFNHQRQRHELWMKKYPNRPDPTYGPAMTGIENERPETRKIYEGPVDPKKLPFDPKEVWEQDLPFTWSDL
jgi:arylsulfatase